MPRRHTGRRVVVGLAIGIVVLIGLGVGTIFLLAEDVETLPHPEQWDARVAPLAEFVEDARGLEFDHPVFVDFLTPAEYTEEVTTDEGDLEDEDRADLDAFAAELRALGLASGPIDLFTALNTVSDSGTLAFYDPDDGRVRVRGTELTPGVRVTLVHELTHALQDQHFDLRKLVSDDLEDGQATAHRALSEGDAIRIEDRYVDEELSADERATYDEEDQASDKEGRAAVEDVPTFLVAGFGVPYALGQPFVTMLDGRGGNRAVNDAFRDPPSTEEHLFDPASYLAKEGAKDLDLGLDEGVEIEDDGVFAPSDWFLLLGDRIDAKQALQAALGWNGSAYGGYERDRRHCIRAVFAGDHADDEDEMRTALTAWHGELQDVLQPFVQLLDVDGHPALDACDPGEDASVLGGDRSDDLLVLPAVHAYLEADGATVLDPAETRCYAGRVIDAYGSTELLDPNGAVFTDATFEDTARDAVLACRAS
jgi:hypothetical protein